MEIVFYAVHKGRQNGIYPGLEKALYQVREYPGARWYAFHSYDKARHFVRSGHTTTFFDETHAIKAEKQGVVVVG